MNFIGGRNVDLNNVALTFDDAPGELELGTIWKVDGDMNLLPNLPIVKALLDISATFISTTIRNRKDYPNFFKKSENYSLSLCLPSGVGSMKDYEGRKHNAKYESLPV